MTVDYIKNSGKKRTTEEAKGEFLKAGLRLAVDEKYQGFNKKMVAYTSEGYKAYATLAHVRNGSKPNVFSIHNPFTIRNIKNIWLPTNAPYYELLSDEFKGTHKKMTWRLKNSELEEFEMTWGNFQIQRRHPDLWKQVQGDRCRKPTNEVKEDIFNSLKNNDVYSGWELVENEELKYKNYNTLMMFKHVDGYLSTSTYARICQQASPFSLFWINNPDISTHNMKTWLLNNNIEYSLKENQMYVGADEKYIFVCPIHREFEATWTNIKSLKGCRKCHFDRLKELTGEKSPNWDFSKDEEDREKGRSIEGYTKWRSKVYKRDKRICQCCRIKCDKNNIAAHHKDGYHWCTERRLDVDNGVTLCHYCHRISENSFHKIYGNKNNTEEQYNDWMKNYREAVIKEKR